MSTTIFSKEGQIGKIILNRPEVFNSFNREMALAVQDHLKDCGSDSNIRAIYLTGMGKAFCAGQDLQEVTEENDLNITRILKEHYNPIIHLLRDIEKPIICAINGVAAGAGANIALACDITIASDKASFIQAFSKIGLIPDSGGTFILPRLIGLQRATALTMLGDKISAELAVQMGMIYKNDPHESLETEAWQITQTLAQMPTKGLGLTKRALNRALRNDLEEQLTLEVELQTAAGATNDFREGVQAFLEKRKPVFKGE